jgi:glutamate 5-kinase
MDYERRPKALAKVQALAAIGQCRLMSMWDQFFAHYRQPVAQILITRNDIADRTQYQNAQNTLSELLAMGVIPIVNENDTLAVAEIKFGDNDTLSAITAAIVRADYLFLMTDVDCLYDKNPRIHEDAQPIRTVQDISQLEADVSSSGSSLGTGGMSTKIVAARLATSAGITTIITRSSKPENIPNIINAEPKKNVRSTQLQPALIQDSHNSGQNSALQSATVSEYSLPSTGITESTVATALSESIGQNEQQSLTPLHTCFLPDIRPIPDRHFWLLHGLAAHGTVYIDEGAHRALSQKAGLLPVGIVGVDGIFAQQEAVKLVVVSNSATSSSHVQGISGKNGRAEFEVGRALVNYSAAEINRIRGLKSSEIHDVLGYADSEYVAHRQNVALFKDNSRPTTPSMILDNATYKINET